MGSYEIKKGLNIRLTGAPEPVVVNGATPTTICVYPQEFRGIRPRLKIKEGDAVKRGSPLFYDKRNPTLQICSPAGGVIQSIVLGRRRALEQIIIRVDAHEQSEAFKKYSAAQLTALPREEALGHLLSTGLWTLIKQRPFAHTAKPEITPKSIFVNAMNTAPFQPDANVLVQGEEAAFQAGLDVLARLTSGSVHLCIDGNKNNANAIAQAKNVQVHSFKGPHPSGNTSVHIYHVDRLKPTDVVWTAQADDVLAIGKLFLEGAYPVTKIIPLGGPGVKAEARKYYRTRIGASLSDIFRNHLEAGEQRIISGDILSGKKVTADGNIRFYDRGFTVIAENRERHFLGWLAPGLKVFSQSRAFLSRWLRPHAEWSLTTSKNGSDRAMVLTGVYDRYVPMDIMVDFLVRSVIAHDTDEAVKLGILETVPEDYALCAFACPSKTDIMSIIQRGLDEIEKEGI